LHPGYSTAYNQHRADDIFGHGLILLVKIFRYLTVITFKINLYFYIL
jgi:hypothetical protein